jgi:magnesium-transporting ATPase (P-type)
MKKICQAGIAATFLYIDHPYADPGVSPFKGLWLLYLALGLIICVLIICGVKWVRITWSYLSNNTGHFHRRKLYVLLSATFVLISGTSAFTFHPNAPNSQNPYFLLAAVFVFAVSAMSIFVQQKKSRHGTDRT